ncbi:hypothetical protein B0H14DRAFT_3695459, partial [Mycena olivaceomarginata]
AEPARRPSCCTRTRFHVCRPRTRPPPLFPERRLHTMDIPGGKHHGLPLVWLARLLDPEPLRSWHNRPRRRPPPRYIRRLPACLRRALGGALDQPNPPAVDRAVQRARLSANPLARIRGLRAPLQQMLGLLELGPRAYEQEGPGVLLHPIPPQPIQSRPHRLAPRRLDQYRECQRFGHQVETWVVLPHAQSEALRAGCTPASKLPRREGPFLALPRMRYQAPRILLVLPYRRPSNHSTYRQTGDLAHRWDILLDGGVDIVICRI